MNEIFGSGVNLVTTAILVGTADLLVLTVTAF
jgi:hypothetical protein